jgi:hypothetical protein
LTALKVPTGADLKMTAAPKGSEDMENGIDCHSPDVNSETYIGQLIMAKKISL